jgi:hypothetical protein
VSEGLKILPSLIIDVLPDLVVALAEGIADALLDLPAAIAEAIRDAIKGGLTGTKRSAGPWAALPLAPPSGQSSPSSAPHWGGRRRLCAGGLAGRSRGTLAGPLPLRC